VVAWYGGRYSAMVEGGLKVTIPQPAKAARAFRGGRCRATCLQLAGLALDKFRLLVQKSALRLVDE
jgi:hypothetical protein